MKELIEFLEKKGFTEAANQFSTDPTTINLNYTNIGKPETVKELAKILKKNNSVTKLLLGFNKIEDEGAKAIADLVKNNNSIADLFLEQNWISSTGAIAIAEALKLNSSITSLSLSDNARIGLFGTKAIAEALKINNSITCLDLWNNTTNVETQSIIRKCLLINALKARATEAITKYVKDDVATQNQMNAIVSKVQTLKNSTNVSEEQNDKIEQIFKRIKLFAEGYKITSEKLTDLKVEIDKMIPTGANEINSTSTTTIFIVKKIIYDNPLLNHPELLQAAVNSKLSTNLIQEAINNNDEELILAGLISVGYDLNLIN